MSAWGSSPHVRGAHSQDEHKQRLAGIIPACAGSTRSRCVCMVRRRDHPRMCGEHPRSLRSGRVRRGSSPHVRGAPILGRRQSLAVGIIPACAGSTSSRHTKPPQYRDHPRMCGEHFLGVLLVGLGQGSSPHVRGALRVDLGTDLARGIIPACAGSTDVVKRLCKSTRDHPRMCGEHTRWAHCLPATRGSSPHVRGARVSRL